MFKILTIGVLLYLLYRLVIGPSVLGAGEDPIQIKKSKKDKKKGEEDDYIDYEEVE